MRKLRVGVLFGGQSGEHAVSVASATSILEALDRERYDVVPIGITRAGEWIATDSPQQLLSIQGEPDGTSRPFPADSGALVQTGRAVEFGVRDASLDVLIPVLHGPRGEDGTVQGLLELAGIPYVGSGVLASAVSMDKGMMKAVLSAAGLPGVAYRTLSLHAWRRDPAAGVRDIEDHLNYPVFVKPCNMGSSVGISRAERADELRSAIDLAFRHDTRVIVEAGVDAREVECGVLGNEEPMVSVPGEVRPHGEFYDYASKYTDGLADLVIPAPLSQDQTATVQSLARRVFEAVQASGLARVDFFVLRDSGEILVNEINTMPGFTATSMYPKLWEASGVPYSELIDRLIQLALARTRGDAEGEAPVP